MMRQANIHNWNNGNVELEFMLSDAPGSLSGFVKDANGAPVVGANVFLPTPTGYPIEGFRSAVTDEFGRYEIADVRAFDAEDRAAYAADIVDTSLRPMSYFTIQHPDFPSTRAPYSDVPQEVNITLWPPAIIEGQVVDLVTGEPVPGVPVQAQGVARGGRYEVRSDNNGHYSLTMSVDHYNIWAAQSDRMPLAVKALKAEPGLRLAGHDIHMVRGGFVNGRILNPMGDPTPIPKGLIYEVGHRGPARPLTGAAVTSTPINADGTFRMHVAPGRNYVFVMNSNAGAFIEVGDGMEVEHDLVVEELTPNGFLMPQEEAPIEDAAQFDTAKPAQKRSPSTSTEEPVQSRIRRDTPTGRMLTKLEEMNTSPLLFEEPWAKVLQDLINLGPNAFPELIEELDATNDDIMLRCLGFALRAIGDKRAMPALIRAIPKTLRPSSSDMGLRIENDETLLRFMQLYDLDDKNSGNAYGFGRPLREIFGALESLSGQKFNHRELNFIDRGGLPSQNYAKELMFHRNASKWRDWWEQTGSADVADPSYEKVNLPPLPDNRPSATPLDKVLKSNHSVSGHVLTSTHEAHTFPMEFYDLETGRFANLPEKWHGKSLAAEDIVEITKWATEQGFDMMGDEYKGEDGNAVYAIRTIGLQAWQLPESRWKSLPPKFTSEELKSEGQPVTGELLLFRDSESGKIDPEKNAPFFFVTREGTPGVLYVGIPVIDDSLKPGVRRNVSDGDRDLDPVAFRKGRRFGFEDLVPEEGGK